MCAVVAAAHAELDQCSELLESDIVSRYKAFRLADSDPRKREFDSVLSRLELSAYTVLLVKGNSIRCYFICSSEEHLMLLRRHFESGFMKTVLQDLFTLLANADKPVVICHLQWDSREYWQTMQQLVCLKALG